MYIFFDTYQYGIKVGFGNWETFFSKGNLFIQLMKIVNNEEKITPIENNTIIAGMDANTHFTINTTIDKKSILMSLITTSSIMCSFS